MNASMKLQKAKEKLMLVDSDNLLEPPVSCDISQKGNPPSLSAAVNNFRTGRSWDFCGLDPGWCPLHTPLHEGDIKGTPPGNPETPQGRDVESCGRGPLLYQEICSRVL